MIAKPKRKHDACALFKLKLLLLSFAIGTLIATFYPMVWLAPPLFALTPFVYIGFSLLWIPIAWRVLNRVTWDKIVRGLILACLVSSIMMGIVFNNRFSHKFDCVQAGTSNSDYDHYCENWGCPPFLLSFEAQDMGQIMLVNRFVESYYCSAKLWLW